MLTRQVAHCSPDCRRSRHSQTLLLPSLFLCPRRVLMHMTCIFRTATGNSWIGDLATICCLLHSAHGSQSSWTCGFKIGASRFCSCCKTLQSMARKRQRKKFKDITSDGNRKQSTKHRGRSSLDQAERVCGSARSSNYSTSSKRITRKGACAPVHNNWHEKPLSLFLRDQFAIKWSGFVWKRSRARVRIGDCRSDHFAIEHKSYLEQMSRKSGKNNLLQRKGNVWLY